MISLEGLTLATGRHAEAGYILRTFAHYVRDGLIPNMFPEGENEGLYHTADATLWFFHALDRYVRRDRRPRDAAQLLLPEAASTSSTQHIARHALRHRRRSGRRPAAPGRRGLPAHLDGRQGGRLGGDAAARQGGRDQRALVQRAAAARAAGCASRARRDARRRDVTPTRSRARSALRASFNERFWYADGGYLYDVVDGEAGGDDAACRPNQVLRHLAAAPGARPRRAGSRCCDGRARAAADAGRPALARARASRLQAELLRRPARARRRLPPGHGLGLADRPVRRRLAARSTPTTAPARAACSTASSTHLGEACVGTISEIFDAEPPYTPRGCIAQAWSVAEVLRAFASPPSP